MSSGSAGAPKATPTNLSSKVSSWGDWQAAERSSSVGFVCLFEHGSAQVYVCVRFLHASIASGYGEQKRFALSVAAALPTLQRGLRESGGTIQNTLPGTRGAKAQSAMDGLKQHSSSSATTQSLQKTL